MKLYLSIMFVSLLFLGSCKKASTTTNNNNPTPESLFKQYEGTWLMAETYNSSTHNYTSTLTVNSDGSITFTNLGIYHNTVTAGYNASSSPPHRLSGILVDAATNTVLGGFFGFQSDITAKTMNANLEYVDGSSNYISSTLNATKQ